MKKSLIVILATLMLMQGLTSCKKQDVGTGEETETKTETSITESETTAKGEDKGPEKPEKENNVMSHFTFDQLSGEGLYADSEGKREAFAHSCKVSNDGIFSNSLQLTPSLGSKVTFGNDLTNTLKETGEMTVAFWYYSFTSLQKPYVFYLPSENGTPGFAISVTDTTLKVECKSDTREPANVRTYDFRGVAEWIHIAVSINYNTKQLHVYRNGTEILPRENGLLKFKKKGYDIGTPKYEDSFGGFSDDHYHTAVFSGRLDDLFIFPKQISKDEIKNIYIKGKNVISPASRDRALFNKLYILAGTGNSIISKGSNLALANGRRFYLNPADTSDKVTEVGGKLYAPKEFFVTYMASVPSDAQLNRVISSVINNKTYYSIESYCTVFNLNVTYTEGKSVIIGNGNADSALKDFIDRYFSGDVEVLPVPEENIYATRSEIKFSDINQNGISLGSPSIVRMSNGELLASYDYNGRHYRPIGGGTNDAGICVSDDNGKTWKHLCDIPNMLWGTLFCVGDSVYLMGRDTATEKAAIVRSDDFGRHFTSSREGQIDRYVQSAHKAPTPAVIHNGRVYIALEDSIGPDGQARGPASYQSYMMSAPVDSDLLKAENWTKSNKVTFDPRWVDPNGYYGGTPTGFGHYEGNAVLGKDGKMYIMLRVDADPSYGISVMLKLSDDNKKLEFERVVNLPVAKDKFSVKYDSVSGCYIALGNVKTCGNYRMQRNVLSMYTSKDLINWTYATTLITDNSLEPIEDVMHKYGYQYPDFIIEGDTLRFVVREASKTTPYLHNANYITYYEINNFRSFIK